MLSVELNFPRLGIFRTFTPAKKQNLIPTNVLPNDYTDLYQKIPDSQKPVIPVE